MRVLNENSVNIVDVLNEDDDLIENNPEQEDCNNDLSQSMNPFDHSSQECLKELIILFQSFIENVYELKCIPQVMNVKVNLKIQYLKVDHPRVY